MAKNVTLKNDEEENIYPVTKTSNVYDDDNKTLEARLSQLKAELLNSINSMARPILDRVYPVGIVIEFVNGYDPNQNMLGQTWEKLPGGYHLLSTNNDNPNMSATDASNHIPGEAAQGGLPNITGGFPAGDNVPPRTGAVYGNKTPGCVTNGSAVGPGANRNFGILIDASLSSNRYGTYQGSGAKVVGDHIAAVMWKRTG